jgi:hypothetical protein
MGKVQFNLRDYSDEYSGVGVEVADLTALQTWDLINGLADDLAGHVDAHSIGTIVTARYNQETQAASDVRPASAFAQRELGFRFYVRDDVNQELGFFTIPCADLAIGSVVAGDDELDLTAAPTAAFVTWLEANALSRDGNAITVERALIVGRNS